MTAFEQFRVALREIAEMPTVQRNPDGDDQAAATMQLIARETLEAVPEPKYEYRGVSGDDDAHEPARWHWHATVDAAISDVLAMGMPGHIERRVAPGAAERADVLIEDLWRVRCSDGGMSDILTDEQEARGWMLESGDMLEHSVRGGPWERVQ